MVGLPNVGGAVGRIVATAQNGLEVIRLGGFDTGTEPAPYRVVETEKMYRLRRYFPDDPGDGYSHVILIPPMMVSANVYDVTADNGAVSILHRHGIIPWVIDFGSPDHEEGGMERTLTDHVLAISRVVDLVHRVVGRDVHLGGYSQGGMFAYQTAAYRRSEGIASVVTYGSPVDVLAALPLGVPASLAVPGAELLADKVFTHLWIPSWLAAPDSSWPIRSRPRAAAWTSCASCTTAMHCCRVRISAGSSNRRAGWHGRARPWPSCSSSSSSTIGWSPADS